MSGPAGHGGGRRAGRDSSGRGTGRDSNDRRTDRDSNDRRTDRDSNDRGTDRDADHRDDGHLAGRRAGGPQAGSGTTPVLIVVRGDASAEEIAALTAVLAAKSGAAARPSAAARSRRITGWGSRPAMLRRPLRHGPGVWRASARPGFRA